MYRIHKYILPAVLVSALLMMAACSKNDGSSAPPMVEKITLLDSTLQDSAFVKALPSTLLLVTGQNLGGMVSVTFNGQAAYFNPAYNTSTHLIITIPQNAPTEATDPKVPNKIKFVTTHGELEYSFVIDIPPPAITAISNENALAGDSVIIYGSSLFLIDKLMLPGNREVTSFVANKAGTRVGFVLPDLSGDTGRLTVHAKYGSAMSDGPLNDHESGDLISNLTEKQEEGEKPVFNWAWWGANRTTDASLFPGARGAYLQNIFGGVGANDGGWWVGNRSGNFNDVKLFGTEVMTREASRYALKFEVNTKEAWKAGIMVLRFNDKYCYRFMPWKTATDNKFDTKNKWQTVTVPLSEFRLTDNGVEGTGAPAATLGDLLKPDASVAFGYRFISDENPIDVFNAAFDNFRIIKTK
jgi:hypothetical protein